MEEDPSVVKAWTENNAPEYFINNIRENTSDGTENNNRPGMKKFVKNEPDNQADNQVGQEEHMQVHIHDSGIKRVWLVHDSNVQNFTQRKKMRGMRFERMNLYRNGS